MGSTYKPLPPLQHQRDVQPHSITALAFDPASDVLWAGSSSAVVSAFSGSRHTGVSFPVGGDRPVQKITVTDQHVRAVGGTGAGVGAWSKGGVNKWFFKNPVALTTFSSLPGNTHSLAVASTMPEILQVNATTGSVMRQAPIPSLITHMHYSHTLLLSGSADGFLRTHDFRTNSRGQIEGAVSAHVSGFQGLDSSGSYAYTTGLGLRQGRPFPDPLVKIYDLRNLRALPPVPFSSGPRFINVHPRRSTTIIIASAQGLINIVDVTNQGVAEFYQLDVPSFLNSSAVSPTGTYLAFGDAEGLVHLLGAGDDDAYTPFNGSEGQPMEWPDPPEPLPEILWDSTTPLNLIGMPYYNAQLLSAYAPPLLSTVPTVHHPPAKIPPIILNTMKMQDFVGYAPLPKELRGRRNMVFTEPQAPSGARFRSVKSTRNEPEPETPLIDQDIPRAYRRVEIEYSKFGVEDFDFAFYNNTSYSGLETHILNSYTNALVQTLHYTMPIRRIAKSHITTSCVREHCLLCEFGFVTRMLEDAKGVNCQSANFCKTLERIPQATAMGLLDYGREGGETDLPSKIQTFNRFILEQLSTEGSGFLSNPRLLPSGSDSPTPSPITQLLGIDAKSVIVCGNCGAQREKETMTHIIDMVYPRKVMSNEQAPPSDLATVLRNSLIRDTTHKASCQTCKQFTNFRSRRDIHKRDMPPILTFNTCIYNQNEDQMRYWMDSKTDGTFLKAKVSIRVAPDSEPAGSFVDSDEVGYELRGMVLSVEGKENSSHLVAIIKVPDSERRDDATSPWYIFNDFSVRNVSEEEALSFTEKWKVPAVLYFERIDQQGALNYSGLPDELDPAILSQDNPISLNRDKSLMRHDLLRFEELPTPGTFVAIDAEFVELQQGETEMRSDGTKRVIRPPRLSLARVSVLRGDGPKQGVPFVDDYIHTSDVIVNYLTEFSGIKFGDLDPHISKHTLVPLKVAYKKLRLLVDLGCIFIGHGLSKDFRIINIFVPADQVIDTVDLYFLKERQRRLSLRFLSWFVLKEDIQKDTHDSIEDARSALMLYKAYQDLESKLEFDAKLEELYREGRRLNWKPPDAQGMRVTSPGPRQSTPASTMTPPPFGASGGFHRSQTSSPARLYSPGPPSAEVFIPGGSRWPRHRHG